MSSDPRRRPTDPLAVKADVVAALRVPRKWVTVSIRTAPDYEVFAYAYDPVLKRFKRCHPTAAATPNTLPG